MYIIFAHTADAGIQVEAADLNALFIDAAQALFSLIVSDLGDVQIRNQREFAIPGDDLECLLVDWLNELLFTFESERLLLAQFEVAVRPDGLTATAFGECIDEARHRLDHEVKAITYHGLQVRQLPDRWTAQVIVDI